MSNTITGTLPHGFKYEGTLQTEYEMRKVATAGELFDAEVEADGAHNQLAFNGALMARQLIRIGSFNGPFSFEQIRSMKPEDFTALRIAQGKLNAVLQDDSSGSESGTK
ncbi:MAG: hypothetical protein K6L74_18165 [Neptuniibacter sp.]